MIAQGPRDIWMLFFIIVPSHLLLAVQIDRYHAMSKDAFLDGVPYRCERHLSRLNRTTECALLCSGLGRPRCMGSALSRGSCWVCGEDFGEMYPSEAIKASMEFYSSGSGNGLLPLIQMLLVKGSIETKHYTTRKCTDRRGNTTKWDHVAWVTTTVNTGISKCSCLFVA